MMPGKFSVPVGPADLDNSRARACCICSGWAFYLDIFSLVYLFFLLSPSPREMAQYRLKHCLKGPLNPKQSTNHIKRSLMLIEGSKVSEQQPAHLCDYCCQLCYMYVIFIWL